jgi:hypothetical protein
MSVDDRIRRGLQEPFEVHADAMDLALERVAQRGRRARLLRRATIAVVAAAIALAVVAVAPTLLRADRDLRPAAPTPSTRLRPPIVVVAEPLRPLVGRYRAGFGSHAASGLTGVWRLLIPASGRIHVSGTLNGQRVATFLRATVDPSTASDTSPVLLFDVMDPGMCVGTGSGAYTVGSDGQHLFFSLIHDACPARRTLLTLADHPWFRES